MNDFLRSVLSGVVAALIMGLLSGNIEFRRFATNLWTVVRVIVTPIGFLALLLMMALPVIVLIEPQGGSFLRACLAALFAGLILWAIRRRSDAEE